ncbi:hypothetical protein F0562_029128 [Nyssa sinensis]|uniref:AAA+ ATPase domain-containing protein n=1 Tax=Nyssa sinensis TaxID=561372 RepID=A0A5J5B272_9ASTE|nr:hypothetical protein F0562_029128 [Nyssa sinensis]
MLEMRGGGGFDQRNLHLNKEFTQIRKAAARVLRDPGTTSSWRSPLSSARSAAANAASSSTNYCYHHYKNGSREAIGGGDNVNKVVEHHSEFPLRVESNGNNGREKKVFLYNWRTKSSSEKSHQRAQGEDDDGNDGSCSVTEESVDDSLSDARNGGDSKSDTCTADRYASMIFRGKDTNFTPSIKKTTKKKWKKNSYFAAMLRQQLQQQIVLSRNSKQALEGLRSIALSLSRDESVSLVEQSDDTEEYCNWADLRRISAASPLLSRLKLKNWSQSPSNLLLSGRKEDSSYSYSTPALSTSSYNRYVNRNPSTVGSWDGTTASYNDGDVEVDELDMLGRRGCGIPCYWSKRTTPKHRGACGSCYSPSLSDTLRRKGSSILCGSQTLYRGRRGSSSSSNKRRLVSRTAHGLIPLLTNNGDGQVGSSVGTGQSDDELSTNYGELDLEALSRLDGRRWSSSCRSQDGLELVALNGEAEDVSTPDNIRSLSQKYRPMFFEELIGQSIVVQSLMNAISRGRIAPVYLFQGPRGTGKTSTARIFSAALNCLATKETKPCGICRECADFVSGKSRYLREFDGTSKKGIDRIRYILKNLSMGPPSPGYKVFVIDECHLLPSKTWLAFLKFLEEPPSRVVFIFITTDLDSVPRTILSRCQKYMFNKIKDGDIVTRLRKISAAENLDVESDALDLIALNADGSLRDAETMLDQLSLLAKRITTSLVNELVGVVSDEKLLELLELAMSSDTAETVKRARELMDSGVDPMVLMSQLATLIMDIIAGTYHIVDAEYSDSFSGGRSFSEAELERLKHALKLLSEAEKQIRISSDRSTWFTATLLQLGSVPSPDPTQSGSSRRQSSKTTEEDPSSTSKEATVQKQRHDAHYTPQKLTSPVSLPNAVNRNSTNQEVSFSMTDGAGYNSKPSHSQLVNGDALMVSHDDVMVGNMIRRCNSNILDDIWVRCIEKCHSNTLKQLLHTHGKLVSISEVEGVFVAYIAFGDIDIKTRAERFLSSITNSFEIVLRCNVEVRIILLPDGETSTNIANLVALPNSLRPKQVETTEMIKRERKAICSSAIDGYSDLDSQQEPLKLSRGSFNDFEGKLTGNLQPTAGSPVLLVEGNGKISSTKERKSEIPMQRIESIIQEQRLETAWLQVAEKGTPGSISRLKLEKNQVLPQDGIYHHNPMESRNSVGFSSQHWEDLLNHEIKVLKINDGKALQKDQIGKRVNHYPISPSLLHGSTLAGTFSKESTGYESGSGAGGCSGLFCWNHTKTNKRSKVKQGTPVCSHTDARFSWFGECGKSKRSENRFRR